MVFDGDECDHLVGRSLHEGLDLAVLIGGTERRERCASNRLAVVAMFAERLCPELHEPGCEIAQRVRVWHEHVDYAAMPHVAYVEQRRDYAGRIIHQIRAGALVEHRAGTDEQVGDADSKQCGGKRADGSEHTVPSANTWRDVQRSDTKLTRERPKRAGFWVCDEHEVIGHLEPGVCHALVRDEKLRHRLGGAAGFGCDDEQRTLERESV